jgi:hypothetical protein
MEPRLFVYSCARAGHGDTWNRGHELHLVADSRVASADVRYGQDENAHGRVPGIFKSEDFIDGRKAEAENRPPVFHGR